METSGAVVEATVDQQETAAGAEAVELLGFYDRVRTKMAAYLEAKGGRLGARTAQALLLVPDVFLLLVRLFLDRATPQPSRALIGGALAYFILPTDIAPEILIGPIGFLDDLVIACTVLGHVLSPGLEAVARRYWSGSSRSFEVLGEVTRNGSHLLGNRLGQRVEALLDRRLIKRDRGI